jgi:hypothetical protein
MKTSEIPRGVERMRERGGHTKCAVPPIVHGLPYPSLAFSLKEAALAEPAAALGKGEKYERLYRVPLFSPAKAWKLNGIAVLA